MAANSGWSEAQWAQARRRRDHASRAQTNARAIAAQLTFRKQHDRAARSQDKGELR